MNAYHLVLEQAHLHPDVKKFPNEIYLPDKPCVNEILEIQDNLFKVVEIIHYPTVVSKHYNQFAENKPTTLYLEYTT